MLTQLTRREIVDNICLRLMINPTWRYMPSSDAIDIFRELSMSEIKNCAILNDEQKKECLTMLAIVTNTTTPKDKTNEKRKPKVTKPTKGTRQFITESGSVTTFNL